MEEHRHVVVGVDAGGDDDVDFGHQVGDGFDAGDVATQSDDREVDERVDPLALELLQLGHGPCLLRLFVPLLRGLLDLGTQDEDVLVHEGLSQCRSLHWPSHGVDLRHSPPSRCPVRPRSGDGGIVPAGGVTPPIPPAPDRPPPGTPLHDPARPGVTMGHGRVGRMWVHLCRPAPIGDAGSSLQPGGPLSPDAGLPDVVIRAATETDLERIVELFVHGSLVEGKEDPADASAYRAALGEIMQGAGEVLVAEVGHEVVGVCQLIVFRHLQSRGGLCAEVESVHVHPDWRSQGIGRILMGAADRPGESPRVLPRAAHLQPGAARRAPLLCRPWVSWPRTRVSSWRWTEPVQGSQLARSWRHPSAARA